MSVYKWPIKIVKEDSPRYGVYFWAEFEEQPLFSGLLGTGFTIGEAVKDLKQVRREFVHWHEKDRDDPKWWRPMTTNGRSK